MVLLDVFEGSRYGCERLEERYGDLSDDSKALYRASTQWLRGERTINVGESATLYRALRFKAWSDGKSVDVVKERTLRKRPICDDQKIIFYPTAELLKIDDTTQWATAAVLAGSAERIDNPPPKLLMTYNAVDQWRRQKEWAVRPDEIIGAQATAFLEMLAGGNPVFVPEEAEDYCFARAFDFSSPEEGAKRWKSLQGHESPRISEMERCLSEYERGKVVDTDDHRVVQALAMKANVEKKEISFSNPHCVGKSWPQFWRFLEDVPEL